MSFGEDGVIHPGPSNNQYLGYQNVAGTYDNMNWIADSSTRWVRIWAHLTSLWPSEGDLKVNLRNELDYQIALAKVYGCGVILCIHHELPSWINGSADNRVLPPSGPNSKWAAVYSALATRYSMNTPNKPYNNLAQVDILEFCNEPNGLASETSDTVQSKVADMWFRAKTISNSLGGWPLSAGPATSDIDTPSRNYWEFVAGLLSKLQANGFYTNAGNNAAAVWTHHNYNDVTYDRGPNSNTASVRADPFAGDGRFDYYHLRSRNVRDLLADTSRGWRGWPYGTLGDAHYFITEGGAKRTSAAAVWTDSILKQNDPTDANWEWWQSMLASRNVARLATDDQGAGCEMFLNEYLITAANDFDSGLIRGANTSLTPRPYYTATYKPFPGRL